MDKEDFRRTLDKYSQELRSLQKDILISRRRIEEIKLVIDKLNALLPLNPKEQSSEVSEPTEEEKSARAKVEKLICKYAKTPPKPTVAEIVCLFYCFGIADPKETTLTTAKYIAKKTGFKTATVRIYLGRFYQERRNNPVKIALNKNLKKVEDFAFEHDLLGFLVVKTHSRIR